MRTIINRWGKIKIDEHLRWFPVAGVLGKFMAFPGFTSGTDQQTERVRT